MKKRVSPVLMGAKGDRVGLRRSQLNSIFLVGKLQTAHGQAKQLSRLIDRLLARIKDKNALTAHRYLLSRVGNRKLALKIWQYRQQIKAERLSGFSTITKLSPRRGDGHEQSILTLLDFVKKEKKVAKSNREKLTSQVKVKSDEKNA